MKTFDVRTKPSEAKGYFLALAQKRTVIFEWENFDAQGVAYGGKEWGDLLDGLGREVTGHDVTDIFVPYEAQPALILDDSRDSYKWPALRSVHSPEVRCWLQEIRRRQLLPDSTIVSVGNWASLEREEMGTLGSIIDEPQPTTLYHGTNTYRWDLAEQVKALHTLPEKERVWRDRVPTAQRDFLFFTTSPGRAAYYANKAVDVDRRRGRRGTKPVVLSFKVTSDDLPRLRADNDYLARADIHGGKTDPVANAWDSLALFGQVAIDGRIPTASLARL